MKKGIGLVLMLVVSASFCARSQAHMTFKKELTKKYEGMKVSCDACHVKGKPKTERNEFGKLFHKEFKDKKITENFKKLDRDGKKQYEKEVMVPEFKKALEKIKKMKKKDTEMTFDELIKAGEIAGISKKEKK